MAIGNTWGLLLVTILLGYGLVTIPYHYWKCGSVAEQRKRIEEKIEEMRQELDASQHHLIFMLTEIMTIRSRRSQYGPEEQEYIDQLVIMTEQYSRESLFADDQESSNLIQSMLFTDNPEGAEMLAVIDLNSIANLHYRTRRAFVRRDQAKAVWDKTCMHYYYLCDVETNELSGSTLWRSTISDPFPGKRMIHLRTSRMCMPRSTGSFSSFLFV